MSFVEPPSEGLTFALVHRGTADEREASASAGRRPDAGEALPVGELAAEVGAILRVGAALREEERRAERAFQRRPFGPDPRPPGALPAGRGAGRSFCFGWTNC